MNQVFKKTLLICLQKHFGGNLIAAVLFGSRARGDAHLESDYDVFLLVKNLPERPMDRQLYVRRAIAAKFAEKISITARTPEEFEHSFPSFYLDLATDGVILYDAGNYMAEKLQHIQKIIVQAGLERKKIDHHFSWEWQYPPKGHWEITWKGYRELTA